MLRKPWTDDEDALILAHYGELGPSGLSKLLPGRSLDNIRMRVMRLRRAGLSVPAPPKPRYARRKQWLPSPAEIAERARMVREGRL